MLSDIKFETKKIAYHGSEFTVRGLGLDILSKLFTAGLRVQIETAAVQLKTAFETEDDGVLNTALASIVTELPGLVANVIALCADEPDAVGVVAKLPLPVQVEALAAIGQLTFDGEEALKNFVSALMTMFSSMTKAMSHAGQIAKIGTQS